MQMLNVTIQSHALSAGARTHYVTDNGVRNGLPLPGEWPSANSSRGASPEGLRPRGVGENGHISKAPGGVQYGRLSGRSEM